MAVSSDPPSARGARRPLAQDTTVEAERRQIDRWRQMSPAEKSAVIAGLTSATFTLARAGVRHRYPDASDRVLFLRLAVVTLGRDLAERAYPEARSLPDS